MYTQLLEAEVASSQRSDGPPTPGEALAELLRCRGRLGTESGGRPGPTDVVGTVTNELAYDIALIALTRSLGIRCEIGRFEQPRQGRRILERYLTQWGIRLDAPPA
jgi:hypothetical protein